MHSQCCGKKTKRNRLLHILISLTFLILEVDVSSNNTITVIYINDVEVEWFQQRQWFSCFAIFGPPQARSEPRLQESTKRFKYRAILSTTLMLKTLRLYASEKMASIRGSRSLFVATCLGRILLDNSLSRSGAWMYT